MTILPLARVFGSDVAVGERPDEVAKCAWRFPALVADAVDEFSRFHVRIAPCLIIATGKDSMYSRIVNGKIRIIGKFAKDCPLTVILNLIY